MPRFINPVPGYAYPPSGKLYFYKAGTNEELDTFADELETIPNPNPVLLGPLGRASNIWFTANARVVLQDANSQQVWERDPVGGQGAFTPFADWVSTISYDSDDIAKLNGTLYISKTGANQGNSPALSSGSNANWGTVNFLNLYDSTYTYASGDIVNTSSGQLWTSQAEANLNNNPADDDGTKWLPAVNGAKIPEVAALNTWINKASSFTIVAGNSYQIDASGVAVNAALPSSLIVGQVITVHNESISTNKVLVTNPSFTIKGPIGSISSGTDLELSIGDTVKLVVKSTVILEVV